MAVDDAPPEAADVGPREYAAFIGQIELLAIWLNSCSLSNAHGPATPDRGVFDFSSHARWESLPDGFRAFHTYTVTIKATDQNLAEIEATFALDFSSALPMTDPIFKVFEDVNLPVNTWPYLRELVSGSLGRFGWAPFTIPSFKVGARTAPPSRRGQRSATGHTRRKKAATDGAG